MAIISFKKHAGPRVERILSRIEALCVRDVDRLSIEQFGAQDDFEHLLILLESKVVINLARDPQENAALAKDAVSLRRAVFDSFEEAKPPAEKLLRAIQDQVDGYHRRPAVDYLMATEVSGLHLADRRKLQREGIIYHLNRKSSGLLDWPEPIANRRKQLDGFDSAGKDWRNCSTVIKAKGPNMALHISGGPLILHTAMFNMLVNRRLRSNRSYGTELQRPTPNTAYAGPLWAISKSGEFPLSGSWWFDDDFSGFPQPRPIDPTWRRMIELDQRRIYASLRSHPMAAMLRSIFLLYSESMQEKDTRSAIVKLWSCLERLSLAEKESNRDILVRRVAGIFQQQDDAAEVMELVRSDRNAIAHELHHAPELGSRASWTFYEAKYFVERMLIFHVTVAKYVQCRDELQMLLDMISRPNGLSLRLKVVKFAMQFKTV